MMTITNIPGFGLPLLRVSGALDFTNCHPLLAALRETGESCPGRIGLDLSDVQAADMTGLALLLTASEWLVRRGTELRIVGLSPAVLEVLGEARSRHRQAPLDRRVQAWLAGNLRVARAS